MYELAAAGWLTAIIAGVGFIMTYVRNGKDQAKRDGMMEQKLKSLAQNIETFGQNLTDRLDRFEERFGEYSASADHRFERLENKVDRLVERRGG